MTTLKKENILIEWLTVSEVWPIIMLRHGGVQVSIVLEKQLRVLHRDLAATRSEP